MATRFSLTGLLIPDLAFLMFSSSGALAQSRRVQKLHDTSTSTNQQSFSAVYLASYKEVSQSVCTSVRVSVCPSLRPRNGWWRGPHRHRNYQPLLKVDPFMNVSLPVGSFHSKLTISTNDRPLPIDSVDLRIPQRAGTPSEVGSRGVGRRIASAANVIRSVDFFRVDCMKWNQVSMGTDGQASQQSNNIDPVPIIRT